MNKVKVIANYLPQYHRIPENDRWWGQGYTDWDAVRRAAVLFDGHEQPKVPLDKFYYSLDKEEDIRWQIDLANKYGVSGFAIYHYWFNTNMHLLSKPAEIIRDNKDLDISYLFLWDNSTWKRTWSNVRNANDWAPDYDNNKTVDGDSDDGILAELDYGDETDWKAHFDYLVSFFKDPRYVKIDGKPVFGFFQPQVQFQVIKDMVRCWERLAKENGLPGIICMTRDNYRGLNLEYRFKYSPLTPYSFSSYVYYKLKDIWAKRTGNIRFYNYDHCWKQVLREAKEAPRTTILSGFVSFDDTPRRGKNGRVILGTTPEKFEYYMKELLHIAERRGDEYVFLTAWNEWGEGAYMEPDQSGKYGYLEALRRAMD